MTSTAAADVADATMCGESASAVLAFTRDRRRVADAAEAELLVAACAWADLNPVESMGGVETYLVAGGDTGIAIAGEGAPEVAEFSIAEFAAAVLGTSTQSGRHLVGQALELRHRLPASGVACRSATWLRGGRAGWPRRPSG